jgi:AraC family transcriptional regulator of adaptative response/methylated-DNA-[protein]-cysteine methyltransferase
MGAAPTKLGQNNILKATWLDTPLGPMLALANDDALYLLEFVDRRGLECEVERLRQKIKTAIIPGLTEPLHSIENEIRQYFSGSLKKFQTPTLFKGSDFQKCVWKELKNIPYGETRSYADIAAKIRRPTAYRAVALANGANQFAIMIPCHRVINNNGELGGYGGGLARKQWLINHEKNKLIGLS